MGFSKSAARLQQGLGFLLAKLLLAKSRDEASWCSSHRGRALPRGRIRATASPDGACTCVPWAGRTRHACSVHVQARKTVSMQSTTGGIGSRTSIALLTGNKSRAMVLGIPGRESWRWPPKGHLGAVFLSGRKEEVLLFYLQTRHSDGAMLVHCTLTLKWTRRVVQAVEYFPEIWAPRPWSNV